MNKPSAERICFVIAPIGDDGSETRRRSDQVSSFSRDIVDRSPEKAGVYALYEGDILIYIGRAQGGNVTIRSRLKDHHTGKEGPCTQRATHYRREVTDEPVSREKALLREFQQRYGALPRCNEKVG